jgi:hypothetical protein
MTKLQKNILRTSHIGIGFFSCLVGWAGMGLIIGFGLYVVSNKLGMKLSYETVFSIAVCLGGLLGAIPFGKLGTNWAAKKWPIDND